MKTFYLIANTEKAESLRLSEEVADYLTSRGKRCVIRSQEQPHARLQEEEVEGILVFGGDGTLLQGAGQPADSVSGHQYGASGLSGGN